MKKKLNIFCMLFSAVTFVLLIIMSINAMIDSQAVNMLSGVVVQIALAAFFVASFIGWVLTMEYIQSK